MASRTTCHNIHPRFICSCADEFPPHAAEVAGTCFTSHILAAAFGHLLARRIANHGCCSLPYIFIPRPRCDPRDLELVHHWVSRSRLRHSVSCWHGYCRIRGIRGSFHLPRSEGIFP